METVFVIKSLQRGLWLYLSDFATDKYDQDLYVAAKFSSYGDAETVLKRGMNEKHWGGYYQIEKHFLQR